MHHNVRTSSGILFMGDIAYVYYMASNLDIDRACMNYKSIFYNNDRLK